MMRRLAVLLLVCLLIGSRQVRAADDALVAHYTFDEGAGAVVRDLSGKGNHGTIHGAKFVKVKRGFALEFDGKDDYVEVPDAPNLRITGAVTAEAWIRKSATGGSGPVLGKNGSNSSRQNYQILIEPAHVSFYLCEGRDERRASATPVRLEKGKWYHVAGTFDGAEARIYVNGALKAAGKFDAFAAGTHANPLYIGASYYADAVGGHFAGLIDDVKIHTRALSEEEIAAACESGMKQMGWDVKSDAAEATAFVQRDTTPPVLNLASPAPDSTAAPDAAISVRFADSGSGIDVASVRILLDEVDVTARAEVGVQGFVLRPEKPLGKGIHRIEVRVSDKAGNPGNRLAWRFGVGVPVPVEARFENGLFLVNDEPFFPIGMYNVDTRPWRRGKPFLAQAAAAGMNYQTVEETADAAQLDLMLKHGMKALKQVAYASKAIARGDMGLIEKALKTKARPTMLGWWAEYPKPTDEWVKTFTQTRAILKESDPHHPVLYMVSWPHAYKKCCAISDAYYVYYYPIVHPDHKDDSIASSYYRVIGPALATAAAEGTGKQIWFISQAFDYRAYAENVEDRPQPPTDFRPNAAELRAINYQALTKGVKGLLFYGPGTHDPKTGEYNTIVKYPEPWKALLKIASELRHLSPTLAAGRPVQTARLVPEEEAIHAIELRHGDLHTLIAVNVTNEPASARWVFAAPARPIVLFEDRAFTARARQMADRFKPLEVHVYQWKLPASEFAALDPSEVEIERTPAPGPARATPRRLEWTGTAVAGRTKTPPKIDGLLTDDCWRNAEPIAGFVTYQAYNEFAPIQTRAKIAFTSDALYLAVTCEEPDVKGLLQLTKTHDGPVWGDDSVEMWFEPEGRGTSAYHLIVNPLGIVYDERIWDEEVPGPEAQPDAKETVRRDDVKWNSRARVKVHKEGNTWTLEAEFPAKALGIDRIAPGAAWRFNLGRTRRSGFVCEMSSWSGVFTSPFAKFGTLEFRE